jgi:hypothetical protein
MRHKRGLLTQSSSDTIRSRGARTATSVTQQREQAIANMSRAYRPKPEPEPTPAPIFTSEPVFLLQTRRAIQLED